MKCYSSEDILGEPQSQRMRQGRRQIAACRRIHKPTCSRDRERAKHEISKQRTVLDIGWLSGAKTADRLIAPPVNIVLSLAVRQLRRKQSRISLRAEQLAVESREDEVVCDRRKWRLESWDTNRILATLSGREERAHPRANVLPAIKVHDIKLVSPAEEFHQRSLRLESLRSPRDSLDDNPATKRFNKWRTHLDGVL